MKDSYVQAFTASILSGTTVEVALGNLKKTLQERGHARLLAQVLKASVRELTAKLAALSPVVTLAKADGVSKETIEAALSLLEATVPATIRIDESLIGGYTASANHQFIDRSYKRALVALYKNIVHREQ